MTTVCLKTEECSLATTYPHPSQGSPKSSSRGDKLRHIEIDELSPRNRSGITSLVKLAFIEHGDCLRCLRASQTPVHRASRTLARAQLRRQTARKQPEMGDRPRPSTTKIVVPSKPNSRRHRLRFRHESWPHEDPGAAQCPEAGVLIASVAIGSGQAMTSRARPCRGLQDTCPQFPSSNRRWPDCNASGTGMNAGLVESRAATHNSRASFLIDRIFDLMFPSGVP